MGYQHAVSDTFVKLYDLRYLPCMYSKKSKPVVHQMIGLLTCISCDLPQWQPVYAVVSIGKISFIIETKRYKTQNKIAQ